MKKKLFTDKLDSGKVIIRDGKGWARVITPPCGVNYDPVSRSWKVNIPNIYGDWTTVSIYDTVAGPMEGFEHAIRLRKKEFNCLLNRRLLPRIRREYVLVKRGGLWGVHDPFTSTYTTFRHRAEAFAYNNDIINRYIKENTLTRDRMIAIAEIA